MKYDIERCAQSERVTVGAALISDKMIPAIKAYMSKERFFNAGIGRIFEAVCCLFNSKKPVDVVSVSEELRRRGTLESCGGMPMLLSLINDVAFADHGEYYAKIAAGYFYEREIIKAAGDLVVSVGEKMDTSDNTAERLNVLCKAVLAKAQLGLPATFDYAKDLYDVLDNILKKNTGRRHEVGFPGLDRVLNGIAPGEVITWGAATNMGKSIIMLNVASHCAARNEPVLYVGTEMSAQETVARHLSILTAVEPSKIRSANLSTEELQRLTGALGDRMVQMPFRILDLPEPSLTDVEAALTANRAQVVFLDYLERFKLPPGDNYRLRVNDFMRRVKNMARRYDVVVHLASQLSREVYGAEEKQPTLSHLSESSSIEKESDRVLLVWSPKKKNEGIDAGFGDRTLEVILAKNRHGRRGLSIDLTLEEKSLRVREKESYPVQENF